MDTYLKVIGGILISLVLYLILAKQGKDISVLLTLAVSVMALAAVISYINPIIDLLTKLRDMGNLDSQMLNVLCKAVGISLLSEIVMQICTDAGNSTIAKTVQFLSTGVILWMAVPLFTKLMDLVEEILVAV